MPSYFIATAGDRTKIISAGGERPSVLLITGSDRIRALRAVISSLPAGANVVIDPEGRLALPPLANVLAHRPAPGITRAEGMRAALRQDPDAIAVDLLEGTEEVELLFNAALTGRWVLAGIDAPDAPAALERLGAWCNPQLRDACAVLVVDSAAGATVTLVSEAAPPRPPPSLEELYTPDNRTRSARDKPLLEVLRNMFEPHRRDAWRPVRGEEEGNGSKMGGRAWLARGEKAPAGFVLALQLDLATLPAGARALAGSGGLLQFFRNPDDDGDQANLARVLPVSASNILAEPSAAHTWTARSIVGWEAFDDFPHREDWPELGITLSEDDEIGVETVQRFSEPDLDAIVRGDPRGLAIAALLAAEFTHFGITTGNLRALYRYRRPAFGDKLLGWPNWEQGPAWPTDSAGERMRHLFQIEFDDSFDAALPSLVASDGRGHLFRSERDPARFAFPWACG